MTQFAQATADCMKWMQTFYLADLSALRFADVAFVFGRNDDRLADVTSSLVQNRIVQQVLVTGSADGKDSGDLKARGYTEASYLTERMVDKGISSESILIEGKATNGSENTRFGLTMLADTFDTASLNMLLILVAHPASLLRLSRNHHMIARKEYHREQVCELVPMPWPEFDPTNPLHQDLVMGELERIVDWPLREDPWADPSEVPADLLESLRDWKVAHKK